MSSYTLRSARCAEGLADGTEGAVRGATEAETDAFRPGAMDDGSFAFAGTHAIAASATMSASGDRRVRLSFPIGSPIGAPSLGRPEPQV
jgi:hypothetical protein